MSLGDYSLGERLIVPAAVWVLVALMSAGFMRGVGGSTARMKIVFRCSMVFAGGMFYCIAWHDVLARIFSWDDAWIGVTVAFGIGSVLLGRWWFAKQSHHSETR